MKAYWVYVTTATADEARAIGKALVAERLAACVNILDPMQSFYWWEGKIEEGRETVLIAKTRQARLEDVIARVKALHSYSVPCVVALPIEAGNPDYLRWILGETGGE
jgi:periplasmic divalent cation tolerance protein